MDAYINDMIKNQYLKDMNFYAEKHTIYRENGEITKEKRKVIHR